MNITGSLKTRTVVFNSGDLATVDAMTNHSAKLKACQMTGKELCNVKSVRLGW